MSKRKSKSKAMPWFRTWFEDWESDEVRSLDYAAYGFLFDLRMRMIQRGGPYPEDFLSHIARERSIARKTVEKMLTKLVALGLIIREDGNIWCEVLADEIEFREDKSEKLSDRNRKTSQKRWQKSQQNQSNGMPEEDRDKEEDGRPHKGGGQDQAVEKNMDSMGSVSADADRPLSGGEDNSPSADDAHSVFAEAFEALCQNDDDPSLAGQHNSHDEDAAKLQNALRLISTCNERDDDLTTPDSLFIARLEDRDVRDFSPAEIRRLERIVAALPEKDDVDFEDAAGEQAHEGVPF